MPHRSILSPLISPLHVSLLLFSVLSSSANAGTNTTSDRYGVYSNFNPSMAIVVVVLISVFFFVGFFSVFLRHCSEQPSVIASSRGMPRKQGLDPAVIASFPVFLYSEVKEIKIGRETLECAVCLSEFEDDESLRLLPKCNHVFHPHCIDAWLISHVTCPVCRAKLNSPPPQPSRQTPQSPLHQSPNSPSQNDIVITVEDEPRRGVSGKFPRSHSTGHSLVKLGWNTERFTLRIPEELRRQIMESAKLKRTRSFDVVLPGEESSRKGYRNGGGGEGSSRGKYFFGWSDGWAALRNPPFGYRGGSVKPNKGAEDGDSVNVRTLLGTVKVPLNCLSFEGSESRRNTRFAV